MGRPAALLKPASLTTIALVIAFLFASADPQAVPHTLSAHAEVATGGGDVLYVSPSGLDSNSGTEDQPWRTMRKATSSLRAGQTAVFEDGVYVETEASRVAHSGTANAPITLRARHKQRATILYRGLADADKLIVIDADYVTVQGFEITQDVRGTTWGDKLVQCWEGADYCTVVGNRIHNAMEPLKAYGNTDAVFDGNRIYGMSVGIGSFNTMNTVIRGNDIVDPEVDGIQVKGGSRNARVYNNVVHTPGRMETGISLGGSSCATCGIYDAGGYEAYGSAAWNNVVISEPPSDTTSGLLIRGCDRCMFSNNVVIGVRTGLSTLKGPGTAEGWSSDVLVNDPTFINNIVTDCTEEAVDFEDVASGLVHDYNLFYDCPKSPREAHGLRGDPRFVEKLSNWHLRADSPAIDSGTTITFVGFDGGVIDVSEDGSGAKRVVPWDVGAFEHYG